MRRPGDGFKLRQMAGKRDPRLCTHCFREISGGWEHPMHLKCMDEILRAL